MKRLFILFVLILTACGTLPPEGNYYIIPADDSFTPEYTYCEFGQCWSGQFKDSVFAPTQEPNFTPEPTAVPTEDICMISPVGNVNVRISPQTGTTIVALMREGMRTQALDMSNGWYKIWWPGNSDYPAPTYGWTLGSLYTVEGNCSF